MPLSLLGWHKLRNVTKSRVVTPGRTGSTVTSVVEEWDYYDEYRIVYVRCYANRTVGVPLTEPVRKGQFLYTERWKETNRNTRYRTCTTKFSAGATGDKHLNGTGCSPYTRFFATPKKTFLSRGDYNGN